MFTAHAAFLLGIHHNMIHNALTHTHDCVLKCTLTALNKSRKTTRHSCMFLLNPHSRTDPPFATGWVVMSTGTTQLISHTHRAQITIWQRMLTRWTMHSSTQLAVWSSHADWGDANLLRIQTGLCANVRRLCASSSGLQRKLSIQFCACTLIKSGNWILTLQ